MANSDKVDNSVNTMIEDTENSKDEAVNDAVVDDDLIDDELDLHPAVDELLSVIELSDTVDDETGYKKAYLAAESGQMKNVFYTYEQIVKIADHVQMLNQNWSDKENHLRINLLENSILYDPANKVRLQPNRKKIARSWMLMIASKRSKSLISHHLELDKYQFSYCEESLCVSPEHVKFNR